MYYEGEVGRNGDYYVWTRAMEKVDEEATKLEILETGLRILFSEIRKKVRIEEFEGAE